MIVNYDEHGWQIITQRCHGLLAGQICAHWASVDRQERWAEILIATTEHDDVFNEFERNPLIDHNGAPLNYKMMGFDEGASNRLINMALTKSRLIALLISRHISFTHGKEASAKSFLNRLTKKELHWLREAGIKKADADSAYQLLEFCDAFSLLICEEQFPPEMRKVEISTGPDATVYTVKKSGGSLVVEPWPFEDQSFKVFYERRIIGRLKFDTDEELRWALQDATVESVSVTLSSA